MTTISIRFNEIEIGESASKVEIIVKSPTINNAL
jgi:hypothetical protein